MLTNTSEKGRNVMIFNVDSHTKFHSKSVSFMQGNQKQKYDKVSLVEIVPVKYYSMFFFQVLMP
jgi:hypothetical protein